MEKYRISRGEGITQEGQESSNFWVQLTPAMGTLLSSPLSRGNRHGKGKTT